MIEDRSVRSWLEDPEFQALPTGQKRNIILNHFDSEYGDDAFSALSPENQDAYRHQFLKDHGAEDLIPTPEPVEQAPEQQPLPFHDPRPQTPTLTRSDRAISEQTAGPMIERERERYESQQRVGQAWERGSLNTRLGELRYQQLIGNDSDEIRAEIKKVKDSMPELYEGEVGIFEDFLSATAELLPLMAEGMKHGAVEGAKGAAVGAGAGVLAGPMSPVSVPAAAGMGAVAGTSYGAANYIAQAEAGLAYDELLELRDQNGNRVDPNIAKNVALGVGLVNGLLEVGQLNVLLKTIPGSKMLFKSAINKALRGALADGTLKSVALRAGARAGTYLGTEVGQEVLQETAVLLGDRIAAEATPLMDAEGIPQLQQQQVLARLAETAEQSLKAFAVLGAPGTAMTTGLDAKNVLLKPGEEGATARDVLGAGPGPQVVEPPPVEETPVPEPEPQAQAEAPDTEPPDADIEAEGFTDEELDAAQDNIDVEEAPATPIDKTSDTPFPSPGERWETDPGAIPGEPTHFLDGNIDSAKAAITYIENDLGQQVYSLTDAQGTELGVFNDFDQAVAAAENKFPEVSTSIDKSERVDDVGTDVEEAPAEPTAEQDAQRAMAAAESVGVTYDGIQEGNPLNPNAKNRYQFTDPETKSTFTVIDLDGIQLALDNLRAEHAEKDKPGAQAREDTVSEEAAPADTGAPIAESEGETGGSVSEGEVEVEGPPPLQFYDDKRGKLVRVAKTPSGNYTFYRSRKDIDKPGDRVRLVPKKYWDTREEAEAALREWAKKQRYQEATEEQIADMKRKAYKLPNVRSKIPPYLRWLARQSWAYDTPQQFIANIDKHVPATMTRAGLMREIKDAGIDGLAGYWQLAQKLKKDFGIEAVDHIEQTNEPVDTTPELTDPGSGHTIGQYTRDIKSGRIDPGITITKKVELADGETVTGDRAIGPLLKEVDERLEQYKKLLDCVGA